MLQKDRNTANIKRLFNPSIRQDFFHPTRLLYALMGLVLFIVVGVYLPKFITIYLPIDYYKVEQPVRIDREIYKPCDTIVMTAIRSSSIDVVAHATEQVYLVNVNGTITKYDPIYDGSLTVKKGNKVIVNLVHQLPCNLVNGNYYIQTIITYPFNGIQKTFTWVTVPFTVSKTATE